MSDRKIDARIVGPVLSKQLGVWGNRGTKSIARAVEQASTSFRRRGQRVFE